jgi:nitrogen fixation NifU-like protein
MDLYADNILEHYRNPRGKEEVDDPSIEHEEKNVSCGDAIKLQLKIEDGSITAVGWSGTGCAISQAAMSMLAEELEGMNVDDASKLSEQNVYDLLGVPISPRRVNCALLSLHVLKNAVNSKLTPP